tara:strand:+ start:239 stop:850 length:612 start_codon:yes stop_codon:yes gene_type:complete
MSSIADDRLNDLKDSVIYHFKINHDKDKLLEESNSVRYNAINEKNLERYKRLGFIEKDTISYDVEDKEWFSNQKDWKMSSKINDDPNSESERLHNIFKKILQVDNLGPRFLTQKEGADVHYHIDGETLCAINFLVRGDQTPISFKDVGHFYYDVALINTNHAHSVPKQVDEDRVLFKLRIKQMTFKEAKEKLVANKNLRELWN